MMKESGQVHWVRVFLIAAAFSTVIVALALHACNGRIASGVKGPNDLGVLPGDAGAALFDLGTTHADTQPAVKGDTSTITFCPSVTGSYGDCQASLGWGFDGKVCRSYTGCGCGPDCDRLFPTAKECAQACAKQGYCNTRALVGSGIARFSVGGTCDSLVACVPTGLEGELGLERTGGCLANPVCDGALLCVLKNPVTIDADFMNRACVDSILDGVTISCSQGLM